MNKTNLKNKKIQKDSLQNKKLVFLLTQVKNELVKLKAQFQNQLSDKE